MTRYAVMFLGVIAFAAGALPSRAETVIEAHYIGEMLYNSSGGIKTGGTYLDDAGLTVKTDLSNLFSVEDARLLVTLLWNNDNTFSDQYVGDLQVVSNIEAGKALRIFEFWYEQALADSLSLRFGLYDLNSEFDAVDTAGFFVNSSHGMGAEFAQSGENGPSIFPVTSLAARLQWQINDSGALRYALLDGVPGDPNDQAKTAIELGDGDGVLHALEYNYTAAGGSRFGFGAWLYSAEFDRIDGTRRDDGNGGFYGFFETHLVKAERQGFDLKAFIRYGVAEDTLNVLDSYLGVGFIATGIFDSRPGDQVGVVVAHASVGDPYRQAADLAGMPTDSHETAIEVGYSTRINEWLRLQPHVHYIVNPGADRSLDDALVFGLRFEMTASSQ
jgi:porin